MLWMREGSDNRVIDYCHRQCSNAKTMVPKDRFGESDVGRYRLLGLNAPSW